MKVYLVKRLVIVLLVLAIAALACDVNPPARTPSPPQMTAGALNATYEARATLTAVAPVPTIQVTPPAP